MGKKRRTGKKEGVLLAILVLFCTFLTGCTLLGIKDGGLGMTNPDYVEPEGESTTSDHTESPDLGEFQKEGTTSWLTEAGYLYGMEGSWYCDSAKTDAGEPYFYSVTFMTGEDGYPLDMWYYGGLLDGEMEDIRFFWDGNYAYGDPLGESLEFWLNTPDGTRSGTIWLELDGECLTIHEMEGEAFFPFTSGSVEKFYLHPVAAAGENYDYSSNEIDVLLAQSEVQERLELGMAIRDVDGMDTIRGEACVLFALGTEHPDQFVAEYYYAVSSSGLVYRMDDLTGEWEPI